MKDAIGYLRVSTSEQGRSGFGLAAQRHDIENFGTREGFTIQSWHQDVQTGAGKDALLLRPGLAQALKGARAARCPLIVSRLDRLSRNVHFITGLMEHRVHFIVAALGLTLASAVFASTGNNSAAKKLFADAAKDVVKRSSVAVYVPVSLQSLGKAALDGCVFSEAERDSYSISIYGRVTEFDKTAPLPCEASDAAFLAGIHGDKKPMPDLSKEPSAQRVVLQNRAPGWFIPVACGGSCAPATLYWQTSTASYWLQLNLGSLASIAAQRTELLEIANSLELISTER
jgi:hypothetical protein